jgi:DnaJ-domain-containing protein 1
MHYTIAQLTERFAEAKTDAKKLKELAEELQHRRVPSAVALLGKVQKALKALPASGAAAARSADVSGMWSTKQPDLWSESERLSPQENEPTTPEVRATRPESPEKSSVDSRGSTNAPADATAAARPSITVDEAYKLLKATPSSTWESIEQNRQQLVQQSHPDRIALLSSEQRLHFQAEARRVNAAYAVLCRFRLGAP